MGTFEDEWRQATNQIICHILRLYFSIDYEICTFALMQNNLPHFETASSNSWNMYIYTDMKIANKQHLSNSQQHCQQSTCQLPASTAQVGKGKLVTSFQGPLWDHFLTFKDDQAPLRAEHRVYDKFRHRENGRSPHGWGKSFGELCICGRAGGHGIQYSWDTVIYDGICYNASNISHMYPWKPLLSRSQATTSTQEEWPVNLLNHSSITAKHHPCNRNWQ